MRLSEIGLVSGVLRTDGHSPMKRIRINHVTEYHYHSAVTFGEHRAMLRPREGHDLHIVSSSASLTPAADVRWLRDFYGNSVAVLTFLEPSDCLRLASDVLVEIHDVDPLDCQIKPTAEAYPFQYPLHEQVEIVPYRVPSYEHDGPALQEWLKSIYQAGRSISTFQLLNALNSRIFETFRYVRREEHGVQTPCETLQKGSGSCRDYAVFMMEAVRHLGFAARFVTGYIQMANDQHGATHAWTEVYVPGAGWCGFDPTNNKTAGAEHVAVGVAREQEKAAPLTGSWSGDPHAFDRLEVSVRVTAEEDTSTLSNPI